MNRSPQPSSPQSDRSAQSDQSGTQSDRSLIRPAPVQASTSQHAPCDARESNALHQKASAIFASSVGKEVIIHPVELSPERHDVMETNVMYQKAGAMFGANVAAREAVSMSQRAENEMETNAMHRSATAKSAAYVGPEVRIRQRAARESRDNVKAIHQKAPSAKFATGSRDEAVMREEVGDMPNTMHHKAASVFAAKAGLKVEARTDVIYQRASAAYATSTPHLDEFRTNHTRLLSKAW